MTEPETTPAPKEKRSGVVSRRLVFWTPFVSGSCLLLPFVLLLVLTLTASSGLEIYVLVAFGAVQSPILILTILPIKLLYAAGGGELLDFVAEAGYKFLEFVAQILVFLAWIPAIVGLVSCFVLWRITTKKTGSRVGPVVSSIVNAVVLCISFFLLVVITAVW